MSLSRVICIFGTLRITNFYGSIFYALKACPNMFAGGRRRPDPGRFSMGIVRPASRPTQRKSNWVAAQRWSPRLRIYYLKLVKY
ncbi:MAG TPA: hypothetical protein VIT23_17600 [Terrimicrobiaceae bacterium]